MATSDKTATAPHLLVVLDHQEARVYRTEVVGAVPERIAPYDPHGYGKHLHSAHEWTDGKRQPERNLAVSLIALETHGRRGLPRLLLGSVADKVIRGASVPVLVHRSPTK
jgi:hypothetical protein